MSDDFDLQLLRRFQGLATWFDATMCVAAGKDEGSGQVFRKSTDAPLLLQDRSGIVEAWRRRELCLVMSQDALPGKCRVEDRHLVNQSIERALARAGRN